METMDLVLELRSPPAEVCSRRTFEVERVAEPDRQAQIDDLVRRTYPNARPLARGAQTATFQDDGFRIVARYLSACQASVIGARRGQAQLFAA